MNWGLLGEGGFGSFEEGRVVEKLGRELGESCVKGLEGGACLEDYFFTPFSIITTISKKTLATFNLFQHLL